MHGDGFTILFGDFLDDAIGAFFTGGVVDYDGRTLGGEGFGDASADSFGGAGDYSNLICELSHDDLRFVSVSSAKILCQPARAR